MDSRDCTIGSHLQSLDLSANTGNYTGGPGTLPITATTSPSVQPSAAHSSKVTHVSEVDSRAVLQEPAAPAQSDLDLDHWRMGRNLVFSRHLIRPNYKPAKPSPSHIPRRAKSNSFNSEPTKGSHGSSKDRSAKDGSKEVTKSPAPKSPAHSMTSYYFASLRSRNEAEGTKKNPKRSITLGSRARTVCRRRGHVRSGRSPELVSASLRQSTWRGIQLVIQRWKCRPHGGVRPESSPRHLALGIMINDARDT
jgi:hypothetical protein